MTGLDKNFLVDTQRNLKKLRDQQISDLKELEGRYHINKEFHEREYASHKRDQDKQLKEEFTAASLAITRIINLYEPSPLSAENFKQCEDELKALFTDNKIKNLGSSTSEEWVDNRIKAQYIYSPELKARVKNLVSNNKVMMVAAACLIASLFCIAVLSSGVILAPGLVFAAALSASTSLPSLLALMLGAIEYKYDEQRVKDRVVMRHDLFKKELGEVGTASGDSNPDQTASKQGAS